MRIEVDDELAQRLDTIRSREWKCRSGKGHSGTVRFLAGFYEQYRSVEELLNETLSRIPQTVEDSFRKAMATAIVNLLSEKTDYMKQATASGP